MASRDRYPWTALVVLVTVALLPAAAGVPWAMGGWEQRQKLDPASAERALDPAASGSYPFTFFGSEVAIDGGTMVVSTTFDRCDAPSWVYVFERSAAGDWIPVTKLYPEDGAWANPGGDCTGYGHAVALDAEEGVIAVGNPTLRLPGEWGAGAVYVFERTGEGWDQAARFTGPVNGEEGEWPGEGNTSHGPSLGASVAVEGDTVVAGAPHAALEPPKRSQGMAEVYQRGSDGEWRRVDRLTADSGAVGEHFAFSVAIDAGVIAAGAPGADEVHLFEQTNASWQLQRIVEPEWVRTELLTIPESFGFAVDLDNQTLAVGAPSGPQLYDLPVVWGEGTAQGLAAVYTSESGEWALEGTLVPAGGGPDSLFGKAIAVDRDRIVVGAPHWPEFTSSLGAAYVYERASDSWTPSTVLQSNETSDWDEFGASVALAGETIAVGAPFDDNRQDGTSAPLNDQGDIPPLVCSQVGCSGLDAGEDAGSVFVFGPLELPGPGG